MRARVAVVLVLSSLAACAPGPDTLVSPDAAAGFWLGLWHGMTVVVTFLVSLFTDSVSMYEVKNSGGWYDFGYFLGLTISLGGSARGTARNSVRAGRVEVTVEAK